MTDFDKYRCTELDCTGKLTEIETDEQTTGEELTEARCEKCNNYYKLQRCPQCGSTTFDHIEQTVSEGWVTPDNLHVKNAENIYELKFVETSQIICRNCSYTVL